MIEINSTGRDVIDILDVIRVLGGTRKKKRDKNWVSKKGRYVRSKGGTGARLIFIIFLWVKSCNLSVCSFPAC
jgi:hypothetical protein